MNSGLCEVKILTNKILRNSSSPAQFILVMTKNKCDNTFFPVRDHFFCPAV